MEAAVLLAEGQSLHLGTDCCAVLITEDIRFICPLFAQLNLAAGVAGCANKCEISSKAPPRKPVVWIASGHLISVCAFLRPLRHRPFLNRPPRRPVGLGSSVHCPAALLMSDKNNDDININKEERIHLEMDSPPGRLSSSPSTSLVLLSSTVPATPLLLLGQYPFISSILF